MQGAWRAEETLQLELRVRGGGLVASCCGPRAAQVAPAAARDEEARVEEARVEEELLALVRESGIEYLAPTLAAKGLASKSGVRAALESMCPEDVAAKLKLNADDEAKFLKLCKQRIMVSATAAAASLGIRDAMWWGRETRCKRRWQSRWGLCCVHLFL